MYKCTKCTCTSLVCACAHWLLLQHVCPTCTGCNMLRLGARFVNFICVLLPRQTNRCVHARASVVQQSLQACILSLARAWLAGVHMCVSSCTCHIQHEARVGSVHRQVCSMCAHASRLSNTVSRVVCAAHMSLRSAQNVPLQIRVHRCSVGDDVLYFCASCASVGRVHARVCHNACAVSRLMLCISNCMSMHGRATLLGQRKRLNRAEFKCA